MSKGKLLIFIFLFPFLAKAQVNYVSNNIFQTDYFIENRGQFDHEQEGKHRILYSTEMPFGNVFFHKNGFSIKQKKSKPKRIHEQPEYSFAMAELMEKTIQLEWIGANPNCELVRDVKSNHYFSFGPEEYKSYGYKKLTYKNIYPNIDIVYNIEDNNRFHYSILLHKGAKVSDLKMKYHNVDVNVLDGETSLELRNTVFSVYEFGLKCNKLNQRKDSLSCLYAISEDVISFNIVGVQTVSEEYEIDPWVSNLTSLTGIGSAHQRGFDVDYDTDGNLYVLGGGAEMHSFMQNPNKIAKYSNLGGLLWTFSCRLTDINWNTASYYSISNFIVDKNTSKIYTGEGSNYGGSGTRIIRLKTTGIYDTFVSKADAKFEEVWELQFNCNNGDIIAMGGSTKSNLTMGTINKTTATTTISSITSYTSFQQDVVSSAIDYSGQLYVILASYSHATPLVNNHIFKCNTPLNSNVWDKWSGYDVFVEINNKLTPETSMSNGFNCLSANANYLFYYDGEHIKAFNLSNGDSVGLPFSIPNHNVKQQGGIESDDCNNVYIGGNNGNVLVFKFDGMNFNLDRQIYINGHNGKSIHDLKASKKSNKLYVSGNGFVAETNFSNCDSAILSSTITSNCLNIAIVNISNTVGGSTFDFVWKRKATNTIVKSKSNTISMSDTLIGIAGEDYELTITRNSICLPARIVKTVTFKPFGNVHFDTVSRCQGQTYTIGARTYSNPGDYKDTIMENGCPKIVLTTLKFLVATKDTVKKTLCSGEVIYIKGNSITQSGFYYDSLQNRFGCDSILMYDIRVLSNSTSNTSVYDTICLGETKLFNNQNLTKAGTYTATLKNIAGCDSIVTLFLEVEVPLQIVRYANICQGDSIKIDTHVFKRSGKYYVSYKSNKGCDSVVELNLTVYPAYLFESKASTCLGKSVSFYGQNYDKTGVYQKRFSTINGCDSVFEMDLWIYRIIGIQQFEFCQGDSLKILNRYVKTSGDYYDTFKLPSGCDSFHLTRVTVKPWTAQHIDTVLCIGDSFIYKNKAYTKAGIIRDTFFSYYKTTCHQYYFIHLDFTPCDTMNECQRILIPTGFTPNLDGINDKLAPIVKSEKVNILNFEVYNRWGQLVYNYFDDKNGWDGSYKGDDAAAGVYSFQLKYKCKEKLYIKSGNVTLLR